MSVQERIAANRRKHEDKQKEMTKLFDPKALAAFMPKND